jgi:hypothetical protein
MIAPPLQRATAFLYPACRKCSGQSFSLVTNHFSQPRSGSCPPFPFQNEKSPGFIPGFSPKSRVVAVLEKVLSVLPSTLIGRIFVGRLFLSAAECPFFDNFFLWFGSHRSLIYNNMREISPTIFCGRARLRNP